MSTGPRRRNRDFDAHLPADDHRRRLGHAVVGRHDHPPRAVDADAGAAGGDGQFRGNPDACPRHGNTGASREDIMQAFLHVAVYAGVPKANHAIKLAKQTLAEMEETGE
jgi:hypothetical protein